MEINQFDNKGAVLRPALGGGADRVTKITSDPDEVRIARRLVRRDRRGRYHARALAVAPISTKEVRELFEARGKKAAFLEFCERAAGCSFFALTLEDGGVPIDEVPTAVAVPALANMFVALRFLHGCGIYHLDPKPANIVYNGRARLIDFGISYEIGKMEFQPTNVYVYWPPDFAVVLLKNARKCKCEHCNGEYGLFAAADAESLEYVLKEFISVQIKYHFFGKVQFKHSRTGKLPQYHWAELAALPAAVEPWRPEEILARRDEWDERAAMPAADVFALGVTLLNLFRRLPAPEFERVAPLIRKMTRAWYGDRVGLDAALAEYRQWLQRRAAAPAAAGVDVDCTALYE